MPSSKGRNLDMAEDYINFRRLHEILGALFSEASKRPFGLYDVERVFWHKGGNPTNQSKPGRLGQTIGRSGLSLPVGRIN